MRVTAGWLGRVNRVWHLPMLKVVRWVGALVLALACARELPSTAPLGSGPLAARPGELEAPQWIPEEPTPKRRAAEPETPSEPDEPEEPEEPSKPPEEAVADARDAGAPDAAAVADGGEVATAPRWAGEYRGEDVSRIRFQEVPERVERDPAARVAVTDRGAGSLGFGLLDSTNGQTICTLQGTVRGDRASIDPGQTCFAAEATSGVIEQGSAKLEKDTLTLDLKVTVRLQLGGDTLEGNIDYHFEGRRR